MKYGSTLIQQKLMEEQGLLTTGLHKLKIFNNISLTVEFEFRQRIFVVDLHHGAQGADAPQ